MENLKENKFVQGYVCAISTIASIIGEHTNVKEALYCCIGNKTIKELLDMGVEKMDIETLKMEGYLNE